jgi:hypothetical protein
LKQIDTSASAWIKDTRDVSRSEGKSDFKFSSRVRTVENLRCQKKTLTRNSNAICLPSFLAKGKKEDIISVQRNIWAMQEGNYVINGTTKIVEGQVTREPDLSDNFSVETADIICSVLNDFTV